MSETDELARVEIDNLKQWNNRKGACCGYLKKKAGTNSSVNKGKWQKRWFSINIQLSPHENYELSYSHNADDKTQRQRYPLDSASIRVSQLDTAKASSEPDIATTSRNYFELFCFDNSTVALEADSPEIMESWIQTLEYVISVATERGKRQQEKGFTTAALSHVPVENAAIDEAVYEATVPEDNSEENNANHHHNNSKEIIDVVIVVSLDFIFNCSESFDVLLVILQGAGLAGLSAAFEISKLDPSCSVVILEGRSRFGYFWL